MTFEMTKFFIGYSIYATSGTGNLNERRMILGKYEKIDSISADKPKCVLGR